MSKLRGFIAVDIDPFPELKEFIKEINIIGADLKIVEPENIHITIKFLGDIYENLIDAIEKIIKDSVQNIEPFCIKLTGSGVFPNRNYIKIIWIGIKKGDQLNKIAKDIDKKLYELGFQKEKRDFSAHITIARVRSSKNKEKIIRLIEKYQNFNFADININSIKLKKSELTPKGPIYTNLKDIKLKIRS